MLRPTGQPGYSGKGTVGPGKGQLPFGWGKEPPNVLGQLLHRARKFLGSFTFGETLGGDLEGREHHGPIAFDDVSGRHHLSRCAIEVLGDRLRLLRRGVAPQGEFLVEDRDLDRMLGRHFSAACACWRRKRTRCSMPWVLSRAFSS